MGKERRIEQIISVDVSKVDDPEVILHPEKDVQSLAELAESIKHQGLLQPIVVRRKGDRYQLVIGHRRLLAAKTYNIPFLKARVVDMDDKTALLATATENIQRIEQDPIAEAKLFQKLMHHHGMSRQEIAEKFGKSEGYVKVRLSLLELDEKIQDMVKRKVLSMGVAEQVARIPDKKMQEQAAYDFYQSQATVESARAIVNSYLSLGPVIEEVPPTERIARATEEIKIKCDFCGEEKQYRKVKVKQICDDCLKHAIYLLEKERLEAGKE